MERIQEKLSIIGESIREKTGKTELLSLDEMPAEIAAIETGIKTEDATAVAGDILSGKTAYAKDVKITGTIPTKTQDDLTVNGATITVPSGYYNSQVSKSVTTTTQAVPSISINNNGLITASTTQTAGYITAGTKSDTKQLTTQAAATIIPTTSEQIAANSGVYTTGVIKVAAMPTVARADTTISTIVDDTNDTFTVTASNDQGTGYVTGANKTASKTITLTASEATVTASDGIKSISKSVVTTTQATPSISVSSSGLITASATQSAGYVTAGTKSATKQLTTKAAATITPGTSNQTIAAGTYLTGTQTIIGDVDLKADNIKKGVNIFGVNGNYSQINFDVVGGTTQPSNPVENTIWVYTDDNNKITSYIFSSQQPTSPTPGMVWFATVVDTNITFNALKENALDIYPITAKQYVSGSFVSREVSIYQEGQWRPWWNGVVFNNGTDYVGGFTVNPGGATATVGSTIYIHRDRVDGSGSVRSNRPVYVRAYTSLKFTMSASWASWGSSGIEHHAVVTVSVVDSETNTTVASKSMNGSNMSSGTHTIPITPPGNFYIVVSAYTYSHYGVIEISISDIHFE